MTFREWMTWVGTPIRAVRSMFPFSRDGRQTLIYLIFAGSGPALTFAVLWAMGALRDAKQWDWFARMSFWILGGALLIIVCGLACFVAVRAVKLGKDGLGVEGWREGDDDPDPVTKAAVDTASAAVEQAGKIVEERSNGVAGN